jgi:hypothetical protein
MDNTYVIIQKIINGNNMILMMDFYLRKINKLVNMRNMMNMDLEYRKISMEIFIGMINMAIVLFLD